MTAPLVSAKIDSISNQAATEEQQKVLVVMEDLGRRSGSVVCGGAGDIV